MTRPVKCSQCGEAIDPSLDPPDGRLPCPGCGATARTTGVELSTTIGVRVSLDMRQTRPGVKGWLARQFTGWELRKSVGDFVRKHRLIDRLDKRYVEKIVTEDGTVLRDVDEPLPKHTGHGSAKFKKQS